MLSAMRRKMLACLLAVPILLTAAFVAPYAHWIGFPRKIDGHWVHPRVTWQWTGYPPLGYPFPAIVQYVYNGPDGREIKHGPLIERGIRGDSVVVARTGYYSEDQPDGTFVEYQTYWGTKLAETVYDHGKQLSVTYYPVPALDK
jgi:hypothetical protein